MCIATSLEIVISVDIMQKYVAGLATMMTMMCMILDELDRWAWAMYIDSIEERFRFQTDGTAEHKDTIKDYRICHQYVSVNQHEDVEEFDFHGCLSQSDV